MLASGVLVHPGTVVPRRVWANQEARAGAGLSTPRSNRPACRSTANQPGVGQADPGGSDGVTHGTPEVSDGYSMTHGGPRWCSRGTTTHSIGQTMDHARVAAAMPARSTSWTLWLFAGLIAMAGCEDTGQSPTPVDPPAVAGSWSGSLNMSGVTAGASFSLTQNGAVVGGTAQIAELLPASSIEGAIDGAGKLIMLIESGCESWFAQMTVAGNEASMSGPMQVDRGACPSGFDDGGTLTLNRN